jgi:ubiquinone/menaquinone biosynthesis C-methylase UbiE
MGDSGKAMFDDFAADYEAHAIDGAYNAYYDRPAVLGLLGDVRGQRVLDAGCGPGLYAEELIARGAEVMAIDASRDMVELARNRLGDRVVVKQHDLATPLEWVKDEEFDAALMALVIHHVDRRDLALKEINRVLRPGGTLIVSTHHPTLDWLRLGGSYFDVEKVKEMWKTTFQVSYWRQPLTATADEFAEAGFVIERLLEPRPAPEMKERYPDDFEKLLKQPAFIAFRLRKS